VALAHTIDLPAGAELRAARLVECVGELVELLDVPSQLDLPAQKFAGDWPGPSPCAPEYGRAWIIAASAVAPDWTAADERAWHHAWLVLGDVLAGCARSPFADAGAGRP
jgi:hypothetical protein